MRALMPSLKLLLGFWIFLSAVEGFAVNWKERVKSQMMRTSRLDLSFSSDVLPRLSEHSSSLNLAMDIDTRDAMTQYQSGGVPLWVPILCITLTGITLLTPVITRKATIKANSRSLDLSQLEGRGGKDEKL